MKIVLIGDTQVGKTSIVTRLTKSKFEENCASTIGAALQSYVVYLETGPVSLQVWDTAGQERFRSLAPMYYRTANVTLIVFDITNRESFNNLEVWIKDVSEKGPQGMKIIVVGNKSDRDEDRGVEPNEGEEFCEKYKCSFYTEVSAKSGKGIPELFRKIARFKEVDLRNQTQLIEFTPLRDDEESSGCC